MKPYLGYIYALLAAIFNGMIGIFSVKIMSTGLSPYAIAFYKQLLIKLREMISELQPRSRLF